MGWTFDQNGGECVAQIDVDLWIIINQGWNIQLIQGPRYEYNTAS